MAKTFSEISVRISANMAELTKSLNRASGDLKKFNGDINKIAGAIGLGFGTQQIAEFTKEIVQLSGKAEGVAGAFNKLPNSIGLMGELRNATKGTISDFELMQRTVQAFNLGIGLKEFPKLLEFATVRAQQTGEAIDYIVQSLVEGIGRKSVLKLDNLGISAERLRNKLGGVSMEAATIGQVTAAFGQIAEEELKLMGGLAETSATKIDQLSASWTDLKINIGQAIAPALNPSIDYLTKLSKVLADRPDKFLTLLGISINELALASDKFFGLEAGNNKSILDIQYSALLAKENTNLAKANEAAKKATDAYTNSIKNGATPAQAYANALDLMNNRIKIFEIEIKKASGFNKLVQINKLKDDLNIFSTSFLSTLKSLKKETQEGILKKQTDADASALENLISRLKDYDRILRAFKVGEAREAVKLIADVTTGALLKPGRFADQQGIKNVQERLFSGLNQGGIRPSGIDALLQNMGIFQVGTTENGLKNINMTIDKFNELKNSAILVNQAFSDAATQGLANFLVGLGDVAAGTTSIGDNVLRALSGFLKQFGSALISLGLGSQAFQNLMKNITNPVTAAAAIAVGTALVVAGGALSRSMSQKVRTPGSGWGGTNGSSMAGNSGFSTGFNAGNQNITITGRLVGSGRDLVAVIDNAYFDNSMRKGG